jgi:hypothetical protein
MRAALHPLQRNRGAWLREYAVAGGLRAVFLENALLSAPANGGRTS